MVNEINVVKKKTFEVFRKMLTMFTKQMGVVYLLNCELTILPVKHCLTEIEYNEAGDEQPEYSIDESFEGIGILIF